MAYQMIQLWLGLLLRLFLIAISVFFIWGTYRGVKELSSIHARLREIRERLPRAAD